MRLRNILSRTVLSVFLISVLGSSAIYMSTHWGPWAFSDSTEYIVAARSLLAGHGLVIPAASGSDMPYTLHPPFYPLLLSALGLIGFDLLEAARWLNILLFGATIFLSGALSFTLFRSTWLALLVSITILTMPSLVDVSSGAMSELLFIFTTVVGIFGLFFYLTHRKRAWLVLSAVFMGLAFLTRYQGVVIIIIGMIALLVIGRTTWKQKIQDNLILCLISLPPPILWFAYTYSQIKILAAHTSIIPAGIWSATIPLRLGFIESIWSWLPIQRFMATYTYQQMRNVSLIGSILVLFLIGFATYSRLKSRNSASAAIMEFDFAMLWIITVVGSIVFLTAAFLFRTPTPDINPRTLLLVQFGLVFGILTLLSYLLDQLRLPRTAGWICAALVLIIIIPNAQASWEFINQYHQNGAGYTNTAWRSSLTLQVLRGMPEDIPVITNESAAVLLLLNRPAYDLCSLPCNPSGTFTYGDDPSDPAQLAFRESGAALVLFYPYCGVQNWQWYANTLAELNALTQNLRRAFSSCDGAIYYYPLPGEN